MVPASSVTVGIVPPDTVRNKLSVCKLPAGCMESKGRTQEQRSAATRQALVSAGRRLWAERGYAEVGTPEIAAAAGVTRGAMYHQFADKADLFLAVAEAVEQDVMTRLLAAVAGAGAGGYCAAWGGPGRGGARPPPPRRSGRRSSRGCRSASTQRCGSCCCSTPPACWGGRSTATSPSATASV